MKKLFKTAITSLIIGLSLPSQADTFEHYQGTLELTKTPSTIVAFDLGPLDTLDALGVPVVGVPKPHTIGHLAKYKDEQYSNVGSFWEPDFEATAALQPDLIIVGGRTSKQLEAMS